MEALTYRYQGHGVSDRQFATREDLKTELEEWQQRDPIIVLRNRLTKRFKNIEPELERIEQEADRIVAEAVEFADQSPAPGYEDLISNVYVK